MTETVLQIAKHFHDGKNMTEGMLNRVEAGIRAYDPCLSCSTMLRTMPLRNPTRGGLNGEILDELERR